MLKVFGVRWWVAVSLVVGLGLTMGCYFPWRMESRIAADPCNATGRVDRMVLDRGPKRVATWWVNYSFNVDGRRYANRVSVASEKLPGKIRVGREIAVRYCCANPELNQPDFISPRLIALRLGLVVGVVCLLGGIVLAVGDLRGRSLLDFSGRRQSRPDDQDLLAGPPPTGFTILAENDRKLIIRHRWLSGRAWLRVIFALFFSGMLAYLILLWSRCSNPTLMSWFYYGTALLAIVVCLAYAVITISGCTYITATRFRVEVVAKHVVTSSFTIKRSVLKKFISQPRMIAKGQGGGIPIGDPVSIQPTGWHEVKAISTQGADTVIVGNCPSEQHGRWLAAKLNSFFGIQAN